MTTDLIQLTSTEIVLPSVTAQAIILRDKALRQARDCQTCDDSFEAETIGDAMRHVQATIKAVDEAHNEAKKPFLDFSRQLDGIRRELTEELTHEKARLGQLLGGFQASEREKQRAAERIAREATHKLVAQAQEEERTLTPVEETQLAQLQANTKTDAVKGMKVRTVTRLKVVDPIAMVLNHPQLFAPRLGCTDEDFPLAISKQTIISALKIGPLHGVESWEEKIASL